SPTSRSSSGTPLPAARLRPMASFRAPRGLRDLLPPDRRGLHRLERIAAELATRYGYRPIETPLFEQAGVFERGIGEVTDGVQKEVVLCPPPAARRSGW